MLQSILFILVLTTDSLALFALEFANMHKNRWEVPYAYQSTMIITKGCLIVITWIGS